MPSQAVADQIKDFWCNKGKKEKLKQKGYWLAKTEGDGGNLF